MVDVYIISVRVVSFMYKLWVKEYVYTVRSLTNLAENQELFPHSLGSLSLPVATELKSMVLFPPLERIRSDGFTTGTLTSTYRVSSGLRVWRMGNGRMESWSIGMGLRWVYTCMERCPVQMLVLLMIRSRGRKTGESSSETRLTGLPQPVATSRNLPRARRL